MSKDQYENIGCGCLIIICLILMAISISIDIGLSYVYVKKNNAPLSCVFATDTITCVQISKQRGK